LEAVDFKTTGKCEKLVVTGCLVKRYFEDIKTDIPEIDELIDLKDFDKFSKIFSDRKAPLRPKRKLLTLSHFAYLRISDGCNNHCNYCSIPSIRGSLKSIPIENLVSEATELAERGVVELIITAQDTANYGKDIYGKPKIAELLAELHKIDGIKLIRLLYLHPAHITSKLIDTMIRLPKVCNYFEIPLQHINDELLSNMNRKVTKARIIEILSEIKAKCADAVIRTTFIVGFPGETETQFIELKDFIVEQKFLRLGIFTYSKEEGTKASEYTNEIPSEAAEKRRDELMMIQQQISEEMMQNFVGKTFSVIIDELGENDIKYIGRSYLDSPEIDGNVFIEEGKAEIGEIVNVEIIDSWEYDLVGNIV
jgi:ribosomal protein S12 methylthiotransferase